MQKKTTSPWIAIFGLAIAIGLLLYLMPEKDSVPPQNRKSQELRTGAGTDAEYTKPCMTLHGIIDEFITSQRAVIKEMAEYPRQVPRTQAEGAIRWHARHLLLEKPNNLSIDDFSRGLTAALGPHGQILAAQADLYQGRAVQRFDIGFKDTLDNEPVTIITDKIFIADTAPSQAKLPAARAEMAIVIDDFGYSGDPIPAFSRIKQPLTFAVLPNRPYSNEAAANALSSGHQVMLHLPMEPQSPTKDHEPIVLSAAMNDAQIQEAVKKTIAAVPGIIGVNNHQGSKATTDRRIMRNVMSVLKARSLFFIDSRTTPESIAYETAKQSGVRTTENELFIDNDPSVSAIKQQLRLAIKLALQHKRLLIIGHARPTTAIALQEMLPEIESAGVRLVFASQFVK